MTKCSTQWVTVCGQTVDDVCSSSKWICVSFLVLNIDSTMSHEVLHVNLLLKDSPP